MRNDLALQGELDQTGPIEDVEFPHQVGPVCIDGLGAQIQSGRDLLRALGMPFRDHKPAAKEAQQAAA